MGFLSAIRSWLDDLSEARYIYILCRKNPEELENYHAKISAIIRDFQGEEYAEFNRWTGQALSAWAIMEERLVVIASLLLKIPPQKAGLIFYSIINFHVWITIITELYPLEPQFSKFQRRWNKLYERLRAEKDNRDRLAHNYIISPKISDNPLRKVIKKASRIDMRSKSQSLAPMTIEQVISFKERIDSISDDLMKLIDDMVEYWGTPTTSPQKLSSPSPDHNP